MANLKKINLKEPPSTTSRNGQIIQTIILYRNFKDTSPFNTKIKKDNSYITNQQNFKKNFGFSIVGGIDSPKGPLGIFVKTICQNGVASKSGLLEPGDEILSVNGISLRGKTHEESIKILKKYGRCSLVLTITKNKKNKSYYCSSDNNTKSSICSDKIYNEKLDLNNSLKIYQSCNQKEINNNIQNDNKIENFNDNNFNSNINNNNNNKVITFEEEEQYYQVIFEDEKEDTFNNEINKKKINISCPYSNICLNKTRTSLRSLNISSSLTTTPNFFINIYNSFSLTKNKGNSLQKVPYSLYNNTKTKGLIKFHKSTAKNCNQQHLNFCHYHFNNGKKYFFGIGRNKLLNNFLNYNTYTMERVVILKRQHSKERLGLGVAIESDEENERVLCVTVEQIDEDSISYIQGLAPGDRIWKINGIDVHKCKRIECLLLFQCAPLLLNLVVSTPYKKISKIPCASDNIKNKQPHFEIRNYNPLLVKKDKNINEHNQEVLESDYQDITIESESSFDKLPLSLSNIPQYLTSDYLCETVNYQMSSRKTDQPSINFTEMSIDQKTNKIEDIKNKDFFFNQSNNIIKKNFNKKEVQNVYSPLLSLINTSSTSSISPDPHSPTHSEDSGFQNDNTATVKSTSLRKVSTSPLPVPSNNSKTSHYNTTSSSPTTYRSVFVRTPDSIGIEKNITLSEEKGFVDEINNCTKEHLNGDKMFGKTTDYYNKARNSNTLYEFMDGKMSKSQPHVLNKIILPTSRKSGPVVPPKPKLLNNVPVFSDDINCLRTNKIFNRATHIYNSDDVDKQNKIASDNDRITSPKKLKPKVSSLIQKFQTGNIVLEDSEEEEEEEIENILVKRNVEGKDSMDFFEVDKGSIGEIILQEDFLIEQDRCSETIIDSQNINNIRNISLSKREISNETNFTCESEAKFKSLAEKYREPTPTEEMISPALKELLEKDSCNHNKTSSHISTISKTNLSTKNDEVLSIVKEKDIPNITGNSSSISSRNSTPVPTIEKFNIFSSSSCSLEDKKENYYFNTSTTNTTTNESINNKPIENNKQYITIEKFKPTTEQEISPTLGIIDSNNSSRSVSRLSNNKKLSNLTQFQIEELQEILKNQFEEYEFFVVHMTRVAGIIDGSVGIILTGAESTSNLPTITIQRVITGSIADREGTLLKGDRLFYIQGKSTVNMSAADARKELKAPAKTVIVVAGRLNKFRTFRHSSSINFNENENTFNSDPNLFTYSQTLINVSLIKNTIGVGFSLDGGIDSSYGNRPIIIKKLFSGSEAMKSGLITAGDILEKVEDTPLEGMTYLDAWKLLKALPEGKVNLSIRKIQK